jgi:DNA repair protein RadA/Sms
MVKTKTIFVCNECGGESAKWQGKCPHCQAWNTLVEEKVISVKSGGIGSQNAARTVMKPERIEDIDSAGLERFVLGMAELDGVLGGGIVPGSSILLGGEPGIGKSTILLQLSKMMEKYGDTLYITAEESMQQVKMRAERLAALSPRMYLMAENNIELALAEASKLDISLLVLDSVQAVFSPDIDSAPGSVSQVRAAATACLAFAREKGCAVILIGHVTKEGTLAGPRVLEHMVDTVLYFEGERNTSFRLLRAVKNRFGSTNEIGIFEMAEKGLIPFAQPSQFFLGQRPALVAGSAVTCVMQGSRPMLLEVQALVVPTAFGNPRRLAAGLDYNRLLIIIAVLERKLGFPLGSRDVYLNIAGGLKIEDPAADLAVAAAVASSLKERPLAENLLIMGEIGLLGEVRSIGQAERRLKEGLSFGFDEALLPKANTEKGNGTKIIKIKDLPEALSILIHNS